MARNNVLLTYVIMDFLFLICGAILIIFSLTSLSGTAESPTITTVAKNLLLREAPLTGAVANAVVIFVSFLISVPAIIMPMTRGWLKFHGYTVVFCALFTMILGLDLWIKTLRTRENLFPVWEAQSSTTQSLIQEELGCCGYYNSTTPPFVVDSICPNAAVANVTVGCVGPFADLGNDFLDMVFTGAFGIVGIDVAVILSIAMLLKDRKEKERYRHIDEKNGAGRF